MSDHEGLYRAILADPDDEWLRLVLADWYEDHGDPDRAEFIRLQCRLAGVLNDPTLYAQGFDPWLRERQLPCWRKFLEQHGPPEVARADLLREADLLQTHQRRWNSAHQRILAGTLLGVADARRGGVRGWVYQRGFPETVACTPEAWYRHATLLRGLLPVRYLRLRGGGAHLLLFWDRLDFTGLQVVRVEGGVVSASDIAALRNSAVVHGLPVLDIRGAMIAYPGVVPTDLADPLESRLPRVLFNTQMTSPPPAWIGQWGAARNR